MESMNAPPGFEWEALRMWLLLSGKEYLCSSCFGCGDGETSSQRASTGNISKPDTNITLCWASPSGFHVMYGSQRQWMLSANNDMKSLHLIEGATCDGGILKCMFWARYICKRVESVNKGVCRNSWFTRIVNWVVEDECVGLVIKVTSSSSRLTFQAAAWVKLAIMWLSTLCSSKSKAPQPAASILSPKFVDKSSWCSHVYKKYDNVDTNLWLNSPPIWCQGRMVWKLEMCHTHLTDLWLCAIWLDFAFYWGVLTGVDGALELLELCRWFQSGVSDILVVRETLPLKALYVFLWSTAQEKEYIL